MKIITRKLYYLIPLLIFLGLAFFFWRGLGLQPKEVPSALIGKHVPRFILSTVEDENAHFTNKDFMGKVSLLNVWATWCISCRVEHPILMDIARSNIVSVYGLNYKDNRQAAQQWLQRYGNPYSKIAFDGAGRVAIDWGVYGTPETYVIDKKGIIRFKYIGPLTQQVWQEQVLPVVKKWQNS